MLEVEDLHAYYGKSHVLQGISFRVGGGEIVSLLGRNGAGRSTTIRTIMGQVRSTGEIRFKGERIDGLKPHEIARRGLGYVPEDREVFPGLTGGEQQMLTICRTLMGDPELIMIDEPTEGLAPKMVQLVRELLEKIASRGVAILMIEQKLTIALAISQRLYVMGHGRIVFEGPPQALRGASEVRKEWLEV